MNKQQNKKSLIQQERERVEKYIKKFIVLDKKGRVCLIEDNATKIETLIRFNPRYGKTTNEENDKCAMVLIKELKTNERLYNDREHVRNIIGRINAENSTRMSGNDMDDLRDIIAAIPKKDLIKMLKNKNKKYELINLLAKETEHDKHANFSFATKFCHYMCIYLFEGEKYQDNYSIYDNNVIKTISCYRDNQEEIPPYKKTMKESPAQYYKRFQNAIDDILERNSDRISRNAFDHIMWYYAKTRENVEST